MKGRRNLLVVFGAATFVPCALFAQSKQFPERSGRPVRVGILMQWDRSRQQAIEKPLIDALHELGWVEDRDIVYDRAYAEEDAARLPALASILVRADRVIE